LIVNQLILELINSDNLYRTSWRDYSIGAQIDGWDDQYPAHNLIKNQVSYNFPHPMYFEVFISSLWLYDCNGKW